MDTGNIDNALDVGVSKPCKQTDSLSTVQQSHTLTNEADSASTSEKENGSASDGEKENGSASDGEKENGSASTGEKENGLVSEDETDLFKSLEDNNTSSVAAPSDKKSPELSLDDATTVDDQTSSHDESTLVLLHEDDQFSFDQSTLVNSQGDDKTSQTQSLMSSHDHLSGSSADEIKPSTNAASSVEETSGGAKSLSLIESLTIELDELVWKYMNSTAKHSKNIDLFRENGVHFELVPIDDSAVVDSLDPPHTPRLLRLKGEDRGSLEQAVVDMKRLIGKCAETVTTLVLPAQSKDVISSISDNFKDSLSGLKCCLFIQY